MLLGNRRDWVTYETVFEDVDGRTLYVITNGDRAMVMLLRGPDDAGEHAISPAAEGECDGYLLGNGQSDTYENHDTIPFAEAQRVVEHIMEHGGWPEWIAWESDR